MTASTSFRLYLGDGSTAASRRVTVPALAPWTELFDPAGYIAEPGLRDAVNVALALGQPLLLTGEPGTGKTQLATSLAYELGQTAPLVFNTKTTSTARDLFYRYDSLAHFHDAQFRPDSVVVEDYIHFEALGLAILLAMEPGQADVALPPALKGHGPIRSVVLVDEIDKAPRDLPNDVLNEIEQMSFVVRETGRTYGADRRHQPIVILTSNSEKSLPDPFLRRCIFYHITFPDAPRLRAIVRNRLGGGVALSPDAVEAAVAQFERIREAALRKRPTTGELLAWIRVLDRLQIDLSRLKAGDAEAVTFTYAILAKTEEDLALLRTQFVPRA